ncbi:hypothetical protein G9464_14170 [Halostella sp. JP-L12]|uniref:hypothetical protein n=1 Tax=Halostella TaxID=1843185 RepID=UPI000EF769A7|nr:MULTISPECIES: hypothetical protein [Halostella]NHN48731.1 hypothetical protein [Halostella sp. JP-L12]
MGIQAIIDSVTLSLIIAAFAGGAFGAALGALPAFCFTGFMVIAGEASNLVTGELAQTGAIEEAVGTGITGSVAFGPVFGPHISFAGGAAAAAYAAKKGYMDTGFDYHEAKNITFALGTKPDVLIVGGLFGILGMVIRQVSAGFAMPWDPIAMGVVLSALFHRLILGYSIIGVTKNGLLDMTPFEREEMRTAAAGGGGAADGPESAADGGAVQSDRLLVEPWLPHQYKWGNVAMIGLVTGILGAYTALQTGSAFLAFGISAASLTFLNLGVEQIPVTHHMTLTSSTIALAVVESGDAALAGLSDPAAVIIGALMGVVCALFGELFQRVFYAHGDTHWDPPAAAIVFGTFIIGIMAIVGLLPTSVWVPLP